MFKSTNRGKNWKAHNDLPFNTGVSALAVTHPATVYAGTSDPNIFGDVFKSTNRGKNWSEIFTGLTGIEVRALAVDATTHPATVYAGTALYGGGVFKRQ